MEAPELQPQQRSPPLSVVLPRHLSLSGGPLTSPDTSNVKTSKKARSAIFDVVSHEYTNLAKISMYHLKLPVTRFEDVEKLLVMLSEINSEIKIEQCRAEINDTEE